jgi:hypothetical protein
MTGFSNFTGLSGNIGLWNGNSGLWGGATGLIEGGGASLYLNFLAGAPLDSRITFSRGSNATLVDSTGKITYAPANLLLQSQTFDNASWTKAAVTVTANATAAPDGTSTADKLTPDVTSASHFAGQTVTTTAVAHTYSAYLKADGYSWAILYASGVNQGVYFDLANGVVGSSFIGAPTSSSITPVGNGWYLCSITFTATTGTAARVYASPANTVSTFAGDGTSGIFVWGAQIEPVTYQTTPSTYVATTTAAYYGPRFDYDPVTLAAKGLLIEEQRTNLLTYSAQFDNAAWTKSNSTVTANAATSPDGTATADALIETTATGTHVTYQVFTFVAATAYTYSAYVKANGRTKFDFASLSGFSPGASFDLTAVTATPLGATSAATITAVGNGWYFCTATRTSAGGSDQAQIRLVDAAGASTYTGNGTSGIFLWGAQLEAGSFATSYIPTVASQVTRSADVASMTGTNFSSWYNQTQGTFVMNFTPDEGLTSGVNRVLAVSQAGAAARVIDVSFLGTNWVNFNGTNTTIIGAASVTSTPQRIATAYASANYGYTINGGTVATDASALVNSPTQMAIGNTVGVNQLNGHIRQIAYYNTRLPNATLQALTA